MSVAWEITDTDRKFLKSLHISEEDEAMKEQQVVGPFARDYERRFAVVHPRKPIIQAPGMFQSYWDMLKFFAASLSVIGVFYMIGRALKYVGEWWMVR